MKKSLFLLFFVSTPSCMALDGVSVVRESTTLQLLCVKAECSLSQFKKNKLEAQTLLKRKEADPFLKEGKKAGDYLTAHVPVPPPKNPVVTLLVTENDRNTHFDWINADVLLLESKLKARLGK